MSTTEKTFVISYTDDILANADISAAELDDLARIACAAKLFEDGRLTVGQAARFYGKGRLEFIAALVRNGYSFANAISEDVEDEWRFGGR